MTLSLSFPFLSPEQNVPPGYSSHMMHITLWASGGDNWLKKCWMFGRDICLQALPAFILHISTLYICGVSYGGGLSQSRNGWLLLGPLYERIRTTGVWPSVTHGKIHSLFPCHFYFIVPPAPFWFKIWISSSQIACISFMWEDVHCTDFFFLYDV